MKPRSGRPSGSPRRQSGARALCARRGIHPTFATQSAGKSPSAAFHRRPEQNGFRGSRAANGRPAPPEPVDFPLAPAKLTPLPGKGTSYQSTESDHGDAGEKEKQGRCVRSKFFSVLVRRAVMSRPIGWLCVGLILAGAVSGGGRGPDKWKIPCYPSRKSGWSGSSRPRLRRNRPEPGCHAYGTTPVLLRL